MFSSNFSVLTDFECNSRPALPPERVMLTSIELDNFKSYQGSHSLAVDGTFAAIGGDNGRGKSNLIDAVLFCLGSDPARLRTSTPQELIYRSGDFQAESASVRLTFR
jgi:chromosome segregation ATPase